MAISNTSILIKRSVGTPTPAALQSGELAYSYASNNIFIGTADGQGALAIGGYNTFQAVNGATNANTASTLVKRDPNGAFYGRLFGVANTAVQLDTGRDFSVSGGDISASAINFNGTSNVTLNASLNPVNGLVAGVYGGATQGTTTIPVVTVAANGRIMAIANTIATSSFIIDDGVNSNTVYSGSTLHIASSQGVVAKVGPLNETISISTDDTVLRSNTTFGNVGQLQNILTDLRISGNLYIDGTQTSVDTNVLKVEDPLIYLASNNSTGDAVDIGFIGQYNYGVQGQTGLIRHAPTHQYYLFHGYTGNVASNSVDVEDASFKLSTLNANLTGGTVSGLKSAISVVDGGTGANTFATGRIVVGNGTGALSSLANVSFSQTGVGANNNTLTSVTVDDYGRFTAATFNPISDLTVPQGGTGAKTFNMGQLIVGNGAGALQSIANTTFTQTGTLSASNTITSLTVDSYGRVTAATASPIAIDTSQVVSGVLPFARGGTNQTSYQIGGLVISDGSRLTSLANTSYVATGSTATNATLTGLTVDAYGRTTSATWQSISGLTVPQGGTGLSTITNNGIMFGQGTLAAGVTAAAGGADITYSHQLLTVDKYGNPVWTTTLDGGRF